MSAKLVEVVEREKHCLLPSPQRSCESSNSVKENFDWNIGRTNKWLELTSILNNSKLVLTHIFPMFSFFYPLKNIKKPFAIWCFQWVYCENIGKKWVKGLICKNHLTYKDMWKNYTQQCAHHLKQQDWKIAKYIAFQKNH